MKRIGTIVLVVLCLLSFYSFAGEGAASLDALIGQLPADSAPSGQKITAELVQRGPEAVATLCAKLVEPGKGDDSKVHYALHGLAVYVGRPGAEAERVMFASTLVSALEKEQRVPVKAFLIRQLQLAGKDEAVDALGRLLGHDVLSEPAAQALTRIGTAKAVKALHTALPEADGARRVTLIRALGQVRAKAAAADIVRFATGGDRDLRDAALYALASIGEPCAAEPLAQAASSSKGHARSAATALYLLYAQRRAEAGDPAACAQVCRDVIKARSTAKEKHAICSALRVLAYSVGAEAKADVLAATKSEDRIVRETAEKLAVTTGMKPDQDGFTWVFNGENLNGWTGSVKGYHVEDGKIVCPRRGGGNLYIDKEYSDFILRFELKLTSRANNGLGIRAVKGKDAAYHGMELQILDDSGFKNLRPYQYHASIYGVVPVTKGHQKPLGEWNFQEVTAKGPQITVKLNGTTILDADITEHFDVVQKGGTTQKISKGDKRNHPGIDNPSGYIGFLGHGAHVEFRNVRIKELKRFWCK